MLHNLICDLYAMYAFLNAKRSREIPLNLIA